VEATKEYKLTSSTCRANCESMDVSMLSSDSRGNLYNHTYTIKQTKCMAQLNCDQKINTHSCFHLYLPENV